MSGSRMSSRTSCGRHLRQAATADAPSLASPTTTNPSASSSRRAKRRKLGWSSTIRIVLFINWMLPCPTPKEHWGNHQFSASHPTNWGCHRCAAQRLSHSVSLVRTGNRRRRLHMRGDNEVKPPMRTVAVAAVALIVSGAGAVFVLNPFGPSVVDPVTARCDQPPVTLGVKRSMADHEEVDVHFTCEGAVQAATIYLPSTAGRHPALVWVH